VVAAIALIVLALYELYQNCEPVKNAIDAIGKALGDFFAPIVKAISTALTWLWNNVLVPLGRFIIDYFVGYWNALVVVWNILSAGVTAVYNGLKWLYDNILKPIGDYVGGALLGAWNALAGGIKWLYDNTMKPVFDALTWVYNTVLKPIGDFLGGVGNALNSAGNAIGNALGLNKTSSTSTSNSTAKTNAINSANNEINTINAQIKTFQDALAKKTITQTQYATAMATQNSNMNIAKANLAKANAMASGGVVESPTIALIGEKGREAVIPLDDSSSFGSAVYEIKPTINIYGNIGGGVTLPQVLDMVTQGVGDAVSKFEAERVRRRQR
jgi:hypothetical protein